MKQIYLLIISVLATNAYAATLHNDIFEYFKETEQHSNTSIAENTKRLHELIYDVKTCNQEEVCAFLNAHEVDLDKQFEAQHELVIDGAKTGMFQQKVFTPLTLAIDRNYCEMVKILIERGSNVNHQTPAIDFHRNKASTFDGTPLHAAVMRGNDEIVKMLLSSGANLTTTDDFNNNPVDLAIKYAKESVIKKLFAYGADLVNYLYPFGNNFIDSNSIKPNVLELMCKEKENRKTTITTVLHENFGLVVQLARLISHYYN